MQRKCHPVASLFIFFYAGYRHNTFNTKDNHNRFFKDCCKQCNKLNIRSKETSK